MSKRTEALQSLRKMTDDELAQHVRDQRRKLFEVRFQQVTGQVENQRQLRVIRKEIARTLTVRIQGPGEEGVEEAPPEPVGARRRGRVKAAAAPATDDSNDEEEQ